MNFLSNNFCSPVKMKLNYVETCKNETNEHETFITCIFASRFLFVQSCYCLIEINLIDLLLFKFKVYPKKENNNIHIFVTSCPNILL